MSGKAKRSLLRRISGWLHLWLGLLSGLVVFVVGITGSAYVFNKEINDLREPWRSVPDRSEKKLLPTQLMAVASQKYPGKRVSFVRYEKDGASYAGISGKGYSYGVYIEPYTGSIIKVKDFSKGGDFFSFMLRGHRSLWLPFNIGRQIVDAAVLIFIVLLVTGMVLWWPKKWNAKSRALSFRIEWRAKFKRLNYDLHKMPGFYSMLLLFVIAATGLVFGYQWMSRTVFFVASGGRSQMTAKRPVSDTTAMAKTAAPLDNLYQRYQPVRGLLFIFNPEKNADPVQVSVNNDPSTNHGTHIHYHDRYTLRELSGAGLYTKPFHESTTAEQLSRLNYDIHTGQVGGLFTKILVFLLGLVTASLPVTGFLIWWGRKKKHQKSAAREKQEMIEGYLRQKRALKTI